MLIAKLGVWHTATVNSKHVQSFLSFFRSPLGDVWEIAPPFPPLGADRGYWTIEYTGGGKGSYRNRVVAIRDAGSASPGSLGMGTSKSWSILRFGQEYRVELTNFSSGNTYALPATGFTNGKMTLVKN